MNINRKKNSSNNINFKFKPEIDQKSEQIVNKLRSSVKTIEQRLIEKGTELKQKLEQQQKARKDREMESCTFSPTILEKKKENNNIISAF